MVETIQDPYSMCRVLQPLLDFTARHLRSMTGWPFQFAPCFVLLHVGAETSWDIYLWFTLQIVWYLPPSIFTILCVDYNDPQALPPIVKEYVPPERGPKPVPEFVVKAVAHPTAEPVGHCRMLYGSVMCVTIHLLYSLVRLSFRFCACLWNEWIRYVWSDCLTGSFQLRLRMPMLKTQCVGFLFWLYYSMWTG